MKMAKLSAEERLAHRRESCRAWRLRNADYSRNWAAEHPELAKERARRYHLAQAAAQRQLLLDAGCVKNPVGRPKKDPEGAAGPRCQRVRNEAYKEYQKAYQKQYKARRLANGWVQLACGLVSPEHAAVLRSGRADKLPAAVRSTDEEKIKCTVIQIPSPPSLTKNGEATS